MDLRHKLTDILKSSNNSDALADPAATTTIDIF